MQRRLLFVGLPLALAVLSVAAPARAQQGPPPPIVAPPAMVGDAAYRVFGDTVTEGSGPPGIQGANCVNQSVFFPGDVIIFRAVITDGPTGKPLMAADAQQRGLKAVVTLSDGTTVPLRIGPHPPFPNAPVHATYWAAGTHIAPTHPTGTLKWTLLVTDAAGHSTSFTPPGQDAGAAVLTIAQKAAPAAPK